jgi:hypothetical protein
MSLGEPDPLKEKEAPGRVTHGHLGSSYVRTRPVRNATTPVRTQPTTRT